MTPRDDEWRELEDVVWAAAALRNRPAPEDITPALLRRLERRHGGPGAAAKLYDIPGRTWRRWKQGGGQSPAHRRQMLRKLREQNARKKWVIGGGHFQVYRRNSDEGRESRYPLQNLQLATERLGDVRSAYIAGNRRGAAEAFIAAIRNPSYRTFLDPDHRAPGTNQAGWSPYTYQGGEQPSFFMTLTALAFGSIVRRDE